MDKVIVVKIGGSTLGGHDTTIEDIVALQQQGKSLVVVHGGGKLITEWLDRQGIPSRFVWVQTGAPTQHILKEGHCGQQEKGTIVCSV